MKFFKAIVICLSMAGITTQAQALNVIDQLQDEFSISYTNNFDRVITAAQSFQQTNDNISGAGIYLSEAPLIPGLSGTGTVTIELWESFPTIGGAGTPLASASAVGTSGVGGGGWLDVFWASPVAVTSGTTYYLKLDSTNLLMGITGTQAGHLYTLGEHLYNGGGVEYESFGWDLTFRTYTSVAPVPVPTAVWLFGTGLLGLIGLRKRNSVVSI